MTRLAAATVLAIALTACSPSDKPPEVPETPAAASVDPEAAPPAPPAPAVTAMPGQMVKSTDDRQAQAMDSYEMTPSDCDALGRKYGELGRDEMLAGLGAKISEKQRATAIAKVEESMNKRADTWIANCMSTLVNKAVVHENIKCALASKSMKAFDVCLNGEGGAQAAPAQAQPKGTPPKGKKK
jgi:hypothetical protein